MSTRTLEPYTTDIPARLDRLPWSRFHWLVVLALGASWAIDGLEVTLKGAVSAEDEVGNRERKEDRHEHGDVAEDDSQDRSDHARYFRQQK